MSTRVVSFRMTENQYDKMMAECHQMGISSAEWIMQKIAHCNQEDEILETIIFKLKIVRKSLATFNCPTEVYNQIIDILYTCSGRV
jgi:hypothetical protein